MADHEDILRQKDLLNAHRQRLAVYLKRQAILGQAHVTPEVASGIIEAHSQIQRTKAILRDWGVDVEDHPDDVDDAASIPEQNEQIRSSIKKQNLDNVLQLSLPFVFISHVENDQPVVSNLCQMLYEAHIPTWVYFRDISAGENKDKAILSALKQCSAVIVVVSRDSADSEEVQAEVHRAFYATKTVIPLIIENDIEMPIRWTLLQQVDWTSDRSKAQLNRLISAFPQMAAQTFNRYLQEPDKFDSMKELLLQYPEWLPIEYNMFFAYHYKKNVLFPEGGLVDCFAARPDSGGIRGYMYYFGSPYERPISDSGKPDNALNKLIDRTVKHTDIACRPLSQDHPIHPKQIMNEGSRRMQDFYYEERNQANLGPYASIDVYLIIGQREHFEHSGLDRRQIVKSGWYKRLSRRNRLYTDGCDVTIEILSYTRLIETYPE
jgi:hypothetical protein